jgi:hypothetical protein
MTKFKFKSLIHVRNSIDLLLTNKFWSCDERGQAFELLVASALALRARYTTPGTPLSTFINRLCGPPAEEVDVTFNIPLLFEMVAAPGSDGLLSEDLVECTKDAKTEYSFPGTWCRTEVEKKLSRAAFDKLEMKRKEYVRTLLGRKDGFVLHMSHTFNPGCDVAMVLPVREPGGRSGKVVFLFECRYWGKSGPNYAEKVDEPSRKALLALADLRKSLVVNSCTDVVKVVFVYCLSGNDGQCAKFDLDVEGNGTTLEALCQSFQCPVSLHLLRSEKELKRLLMHSMYFILPDMDEPTLHPLTKKKQM